MDVTTGHIVSRSCSPVVVSKAATCTVLPFDSPPTRLPIQALFTWGTGTRPVCPEAIPELGQVQSPAEELFEQAAVGQCFVEYQQHFVAGTLGTSQRLD